MYHFRNTSHNQKLIIIIYIDTKIAHTGGSFMEKMNFLPKSNDLESVLRLTKRYLQIAIEKRFLAILCTMRLKFVSL